MRNRIYEYLEGRCARSEEIAVEVLKLAGASGVVADKIVQAAVSDDTRISRDAEGFWFLKPSARSIQKTAFLSLSPKYSVNSGFPQLESLSAVRFNTTGPQALFGETRLQGETEKAGFLCFARFWDGAVPVAFRLNGVLSATNRTSRRVNGKSLMDEGICLFRLGRLMYPDQPIPSIEALADAVGVAYVTERECDGEAQLQAEIFLHLLGRVGKDISTVEELLYRLHPDDTPLDFEAYAFDERYLNDLPQDPGVYVMRDRTGTVIYVGKSVNLRERVGTYFAKRSTSSEKTRGILERIWSVEVEVVGSELEALLLESQMISKSRPEFNTQMEVHISEETSQREIHFVLLLPSSDPESLELFCVRNGKGIDRIRVRRDLADWVHARDEISGYFHDTIVDKNGVSEEDQRDIEILKRWMKKYRDQVNWVDMDDSEDTMRVLEEYVQNCESEGWEKVWRV